MEFRNTSAINPQRPEALVKMSSGAVMADDGRVASETHLMNSLSIQIAFSVPRIPNVTTKGEKEDSGFRVYLVAKPVSNRWRGDARRVTLIGQVFRSIFRRASKKISTVCQRSAKIISH